MVYGELANGGRVLRASVPTVRQYRSLTVEKINVSIPTQARNHHGRRTWAIAIPAVLSGIFAFNVGAALFGALWLAASGKWSALEFELLSDALVTPVLFPLFVLALTPGMFLVSTRARALRDGRRLTASLCYAAISIWTALIIASWCCLCFHSVSLDPGNRSFWPSLFFAYAMAALPTQWLSRAPWDGGSGPWGRLLPHLVRVHVQTPRP